VTLTAGAGPAVGDQTSAPDQTTLITNDAEAFALGPIDATTVGLLSAFCFKGFLQLVHGWLWVSRVPGLQWPWNHLLILELCNSFVCLLNYSSL